MKKALSIFMFCSLLLLITIGTTQAYDENYTRLEWPTQTEPTIDGMWTSDEEWIDTNFTIVNENFTFGSTWSQVVFVTSQFIIEILNDNTDDAGDYWQMCIDGTSDGGSTPQTGDFKIEVVGHTTPTVYEGDGTDWTEITPDVGELNFSDSISASPTSSTPHWIAELTIWKSGGVVLMDPAWVVRVAVYDESNSAAGVQAWPPGSDPDVPDEWGLNNYSTTPYPEDLSLGVAVLLSSVAVIVATRRFRKRSKTDKSS